MVSRSCERLKIGAHGISRKRRIGSTSNSSNVYFNGSQRPSVAQRLEYLDSDCYD